MTSETSKRKRSGGRAGHAARRGPAAIHQAPWTVPVNPDRPTEPLPPEGVAAIHDTAMRVLEEIGVAFLNPEAREILKQAGCRLDGDIVFMDRDFVMEMIGHAPAQWTITPRNPDRQITIGGQHILFGNVSSPPNYWDLELGRKLPGTREFHSRFVKLSQYYNCIHFIGGYAVEPVDLHPSTRHLDTIFDKLTLSDKAPHAYALGKERIEDGMEMVRIAAGTRNAARFVLNDGGEAAAQAQQGPQGLRLVFSQKYLVGTLALWVTYFMGLVIVYGLVNWMPVLFKEAGVPASQAAVIAALFQLGGVGAIFVGLLMDRWNANLIIATGYFLTSLGVAFIGQVLGGGVGMLVASVFIAGLLMNAAQSSMQALAAEYYPTECRASGVSWMLGIGRFGGIAGSFLVAELSRRHLELPQVFMVVAIPGVIAALALLVKNRYAGGAPRTSMLGLGGAH